MSELRLVCRDPHLTHTCTLYTKTHKDTHTNALAVHKKSPKQTKTTSQNGLGISGTPRIFAVNEISFFFFSPQQSQYTLHCWAINFSFVLFNLWPLLCRVHFQSRLVLLCLIDHSASSPVGTVDSGS